LIGTTGRFLSRRAVAPETGRLAPRIHIGPSPDTVPGVNPLRLPVFRRLFAAYTVNEIGDSIALVALALLVFDRTGSALSTTALFLATRFLPALLAPVLTAHADQYPLRLVLPLL
jgi:hypothetical protein